jgi:hypothetical protein
MKNIIAFFSSRAAELPPKQNNRIKRDVESNDKFNISFSPTNNQYIIYTIPRFPDFYQNGIIKCDILAYSNCNEGEIKWNVEVEIDNKFGEVNSVVQKIPKDFNKIFESTVELTDKFKAGDFVRFKVSRDSINDSAIDDVKFLSITIYEEVLNLDLTKYESVIANTFSPNGIKIPSLNDDKAAAETIYFSLNKNTLVYKNIYDLIIPIQFKSESL